MNRHFVIGANREELAQAQAQPAEIKIDSFRSLSSPAPCCRFSVSLLSLMAAALGMKLSLSSHTLTLSLFLSLSLSLSLFLSLSFSQTPSLVSFDIALLESRGKDVGELVHGRLAHSLVHLSAHALRDVSIGARLLCYRPADGSSDTT